MAAWPSTSKSPALRIAQAETPEEIETAQALFREYQQELGIDLCFQNFDGELAALPGKYARPGGCLLLAWKDGAAVGCVAVRPWNGEVCELKRLFLRPEARGTGAGRLLTETALQEARRAGYRRIRLDTLPQMGAAIRLYRDLGFQEIGAYTKNPIAGALFLEKNLELVEQAPSG